MKLGKREIDALTCPPERRDRLVFDEDLPGFAVRVTRDGAKTFLFQYRRGEAVRRLRLGRYGDVTPAQARKAAEIARGQVANGGDPAGERRAALKTEASEAQARRATAEADALTLGHLVDLWQQQQLEHRSAVYRREAPRALRVGLAVLLPLPAHAVDAPAVRRALDAIPRRVRGRPAQTRPDAAPTRGEAMARRVRDYGAALFSWAVKRELVPSNPFLAVRRESRELTRDRVLSDAELGEVWRAADTLGWPWGPYFRLLLLTLQREREVAGMAWSELAPDLSSWTLPAARTKNRKAHIVHLPEPARAILRTMPRMAGSPLVFTTNARTPISGFSHAKLRLVAAIAAERAQRAAAAGREAEPIEPWRLHDFRRSGVTVLARMQVRWEVADRILNHVQGAIRGVAAVYQRHDFLQERAAAMELWAEHLRTLAAPAPDR